MGLGWFIPRSERTWEVAQWVGRVLGLPLLRGYADAWMFWAGGTVVFEPKSDACPTVRYRDPATSPALPVFRTQDTALLRSRFERFGVPVLAEIDTVAAATLIVGDPFGHLLGFRESARDSKIPADQAADRRASEPVEMRFNPGTPPMPPHIDRLDWIVRHVADLDAATDFYQRALNVPILVRDDRGAVLDLGQQHCLELRAGGAPETTPRDRFEVPDTFILRVNDFDAFKAHLESRGAVTVNDRIQFGRGALGYVADPEGHLIGFEERYEQEQCPDDVVAFSEDLEANRRDKSKERP